MNQLTQQPTIGWSQFALDHSRREQGNSYTTLPQDELIRRIQENWELRKPGDGETGIDRKVLVPLSPIGFFCPLRAKLVDGLPVKARLTRRQAHEDSYIETFVTEADAKAAKALIETPATKVDVVCYSAEALTENGGARTTDCDWEIVTILCHDVEGPKPMTPLTMARNQLEKSGGTKSEYTSQEYAESIYFYATQKDIKVLAE